MKLKAKLLISLICVLLLAATLTAIIASAEDPTAPTGEMVDIVANFKDYLVQDTVRGKDNYVGDYQYTIYYDYNEEKDNKVISGYHGTPVIVYTVNHPGVERVGTDSNTKIIQSMLDRGYAVIVLDYLESKNAVSPAIEYSVQQFRADLVYGYGKMLTNTDVFTEGNYRENFAVPSGCNVLLNNVFWEIDKHSADGTFEKIVENWNSDFRATKGGNLVYWCHADGERKAVQEDFNGNAPVWFDENGNVDENGKYTYIKYTKAEVITDCVKPDGSFLDMNLYLHLVYPTSPDGEIPVIALANNAGYPTSAVTTEDDLRPQLSYPLYNGYAFAVFDYLWQPMGRNAAYGYYDGAQGVSSDHMNYSLHIYNDKLVNTAAMRFLRYASLSNGFNFDLDKIGVIGNSKGGWHNFLGEASVQSELIKNPESYATIAELEDAISLALESFIPERLYNGHHGETRYTAGAGTVTGDGITLAAGERQPWLTYDGKEIISGAAITVPENGGSEEDITSGHMPIYVTSNMDDYLHAQYGVTMRIYNICRELDLPLLHLELPIGHTYPSGPDINYNVDAYDIFGRFCGYYLKDEAISVAYVTPGNKAGNVSATEKITVAFVGQVKDAEAIKAITVTAGGEAVSGSWDSSFGGVVWTFTPDSLKGNTEYTVTVPAGFAGSNGTKTESAYTSSFITELDVSCEPIAVSEKTYTFLAPSFTSGNGFVFKFNVTNDAANVAEVYAEGTLLGSVNLRGAGSYEIDITDYVAKNSGKEITLTLKEGRTVGEVSVKNDSLAEGSLNSDITPNNTNITYTYQNEVDGKTALGAAVTGVYNYTYSKYYNNATKIFKYNNVLGSTAVTKDDLGRLYTFSIDIYDTVDRTFQVRLRNMADQTGHQTIDYDWCIFNLQTKANEWTTCTFTYREYEPDYGLMSNGKSQYLELFVSPDGNNDSPIYLKDLIITETVTDINVGSAVIAEKQMLGGAYVAPVSDNPFAIYNGDTLVGEYASFTSALSAYTSGYMLKLQSDYTFTDSDVSDKLKSFESFNFDLGSYTFTCKNTKNSPLWLKATNAAAAKINISGGTVLVGDTPIVSYESSSYSGKSISVSFTDCYIGFDDCSATTKVISATTVPTGIILNSSISFDNCEFELPDGKHAYDAAVIFPGSTAQTLELAYEVTGGTLSLSGERWISVSDNVSAVKFSADESGARTRLVLPASYTFALLGTHYTDKGYASYVPVSEESNMVSYELDVPANATEYGVIPEEYLDGTKYPFILFKDGSFVSAHETLSSATKAASKALSDATEDDVAVVLMRSDFTTKSDTTSVLNTSAGKVIFDLGGHTLTRGTKALGSAELGETTPLHCKSYTVYKNGRIESKSALMFQTNFLFSTTVAKEYDILFENVTIGYAKGATSLNNALWNIWLNDHNTSVVITDITFRDCTFDFKTNAPSTVSSTTLMNLSKAWEARFNVVIEGGKIVGNGTNIKLASADKYDTLTLKPGKDGEYIRLTEGTVAPDISNFVFDDGKYRTFAEDSETGEYILSEGGASTPYGTIPADYASAETYPFAFFKYNSSSKKYEFKKALKTWNSATGWIDDYAKSSGTDVVLLVRRDFINTDDGCNDSAFASVGGKLTVDLGGFTFTKDNKTALSFSCLSDLQQKGEIIIKNGKLLTVGTSMIASNKNSKLTADKEWNITFDGVTFGFAEGAVRKDYTFWVNWDNGGSMVMNFNLTFNDCTLDLKNNLPSGKPILFRFTTGSGSSSNNEFKITATFSGGQILSDNIGGVELFKLDAESDTVTFAKNSNGEYTKLISKTTAKDASHYNKAFVTAEGDKYFVEMLDDGITSVYELASLETAYGTAPTTAKYLSAVDYPFFLFQGGAFVSAHESWTAAMEAALLLVTDEGSRAEIVMRRDYDVYKAVDKSVNFNTARGEVVLDLGGRTITTVDGYFIDISIKNASASFLGYKSSLTVKNGTLFNKRSTLPSIGIGHSGTSPSGERKFFDFDFENVTFKTINYSIFRDWEHSGATGIELDFTFTDCVFDFSITEKSTVMFYFKSGKTNVPVTLNFVGGQIVADKMENYTFVNYGNGDKIIFAQDESGSYTTLTNPARYAAPTLEFANEYGKTLVFVKDSEKSNMSIYKLMPKSVVTMIPEVSITLDRDLIYNVYVPKNDDIISVTLGGVEYTELAALEQRDIDGKTFYVLRHAPIAKYAAEAFVLEVYIDIGGKTARGSWTLGLERYAGLVIADDTVTNTEKTLITDMLSYVGAAYTYFGSENAVEVNERIDAIIGADWEENNAPELSGSSVAPTEGFTYVTYVLDASPTIRFYLPKGADANSYEFFADGRKLSTEIVTENGETYIDLDVYAYVLSKTITYRIGGKEMGSYHINCYYEYSKTLGNDKLTALVERFARYCESADKYRSAEIENK